jgi:hypothetical protein
MPRFQVGQLPAWVQAILFCSILIGIHVPCFGQAQSNAANLEGFIRDPQGAVIPNANVTARNQQINITRTVVTNKDGFYNIVQLPPNEYELVVEAPNFKRVIIPSVKVTVGQRADLDVTLEAGNIGESVTISATTEVVETSRTAIANTIEQQRIENLPINERSYLNFALTVSNVTRDNARPIGPAPTSGINFGGQRGRSNLIQVDGADHTDNSINAARSTISQEAVQEFQVVTNSFMPEFGRTSGGVVNVVTKSGTNDLRGNLFGFLRHRSFQARNPFAPIEDPPFTRAQYGATLGGPMVKDRLFFFAAFEQRRRQESGFFTSEVAQGLNGSVTIGAPYLPFTQVFRNITPGQATAINSLLAQNPAAAIQYAYLASSGGSIALNGTNPLISTGGTIPIPAGQVIGSRFLASGNPVPISQNAFRPLQQLQRIFPLSEATTYSSFRLDHHINENHQFTTRFSYNPQDLTGIQVESQNQSLGQNDFSRTGIQRLRDYGAVVSLTSTLSSNVVNEARFNYGKRKAAFRSQNGEAVAYNIAGTAFIGRELFSPVDRTENRYQYTDNVNWILGNHTFKFGADVNFIDVKALFELNFAGLYNFGGISPAALGLPSSLPSLTPVQQYGAGLPNNYIQGFGNPNSTFENKPLAVFAQDSWKIRHNLTLNYGVRYDIELTNPIAPVPFTDPLTGITLSAADIEAAQNVLNVQQGFPRDKNNIAPRVGIAWDPFDDGKTVVRAAFGIFYDHPLLAIGFNSDIADAAQQQQLVAITGSPSTTALLNATQVFQGTVVPGVTLGVAPTAQYQLGRQRFNDQTFPGFGSVLPFTLPVSRDFEYAYANQANLTIERQIGNNLSASASYIFVGARHLPHPHDVNAPRNDLAIANYNRFAGLPAGTVPNDTTVVNAFSVPLTSTGPITVIIPGMVAVRSGQNGGVFVNPAIANFFRPNGPNYFLARSLGATKSQLDAALAGSLRTPGVITPFGAVNAQVSDGNSSYNALNLEMKKRFSNNFQFLASYTWSHAIDDSSDLQTLLLPQENRNFRAERADSLFDQRHRFVFSGALMSPTGWRTSDSSIKRIFSDFTVAPILELSSGRPFNILSGVDTNNDQTNQTDRPSVRPDGTLFVPGAFQAGNLGRNRGITRGYASLDMRLTRAIRIGERVRLDVIAEGFNLFNRFNEAAASPFVGQVVEFNKRDDSGRYYSRPTASFDPRQFQFGLKLNF